MLDLIDRLPGLVGDLLEVHPNQDRTTNVVADTTCLAALTPIQVSDLFALLVKLLNLPPPGTRLLLRSLVTQVSINTARKGSRL